MRQLTLVSLYGHKPSELIRLLQGCIRIIDSSKLRPVFKPYNINQIHGTLVGMEKLLGYTKHYNANTWVAAEKKSGVGIKTEMDFAKLRSVIKNHIPMTVQLGGFTPGFTQFDSLGLWPYERSFQVQWDSRRFTLIGWPHEDDNFTSKRILDDLRKELDQGCNVMHKYPKDNDFFMVLGEIVGLDRLSTSEIENLKDEAKILEREVRDFLAAKKNTLQLRVEEDHVCIAQYQRETLPLDSTVPYRIGESRMTPSFIENLYD